MPPVRHAALPHGAELEVRPVAPSDIDGLRALYEGLDDDARYRRFFTMFRPDRSFFERLTTVDDRGGAGLVATVTDAGGAARIVGEASYEPLADGDGELAITVDRSWRGWIGPYLLDALLEVAAANGVPNLEADILAVNGPMLALARARGNALLPSEDWTVVRVVVGTGGSVPTWPNVRRGLRVLVEGGGVLWHAADAVRRAGHQVLSCPGPHARRGRCPLLDGRRCPLVDAADVIVVAHPPAEHAWRDLRSAHARQSVVPVCIELARHDRALPTERPMPEGSDDAVVATLEDAASHRSPTEGAHR